MSSSLDLIKSLTNDDPDTKNYEKLLAEFSKFFGWRPSSRVKDDQFSTIVNAHIMIEHGLENTAVLSFIKDFDFSELDTVERNKFISISYNNLVDWHVIIQEDAVYYIYNRNSLMHLNKIVLDEKSAEMLRYESFQKLVGRRPNPNIPSLDEALIRRIEYWKTNLPNSIENLSIEETSDIFNAIIFIRSLEDINRLTDRPLIKEVSAGKSFTEAISISLRQLNTNPSEEFFRVDSLKRLDELDARDLVSLVKDFYGNSYFSYDFSLMTKHALGKIYEKYVSILEITQDSQPTLFPRPLRESRKKSLGTFYTPQYIASFFSKEVNNFYSISELENLKVIDPTCGSGVFLRNLLENIIDENNLFNDTAKNEILFQNAFGIDINYNASQASKLSLALLHLVVTGSLPEKLSIMNEEVVSYYMSNLDQYETFDVVISNPPYLDFAHFSGQAA